MRDLFPGYDVLAKRDTPSWNDATRDVIDHRLAIDPEAHRFFNEAEWLVLRALCDRIVPQPPERAPIPVAAMIDDKMHANKTDGYRHVDMPDMREAWRRGLAALDAEAQTAHGARFHECVASDQDALLRQMQAGDMRDAAWRGMAPAPFFKQRVLTDITKGYYAHPTAWNEIGWGGPASPRGYVRMDFDRRDPWEAAEAKPGHEDEAFRENKRVGR